MGIESSGLGTMSSHHAQNLHWFRPATSAGADTFVLIHGFAGGWQSWEPVVASIPPDAGVAALVLPGHSGNDLRFSDFMEIAEWAASLIPPNAHLAGYSAGGRVALGALAAGAQCARLSLISSGFGGLSPSDRMARAASDAVWSTLLRTSGMQAFIQAWEELPIFATQSRARAELRDAQTQHRLTLDPFALADAMDALSVARMPDLRPTLARLSMPIQLVVGADDTKYVANAEDAVRSLKHGRVSRIGACGHNPLLEAPEVLARVLTNFRA